MAHYNRKRAALPPQPRPDSLDRSLPFRNNEARLKLIYEGQQLFKERPKEPSFRKQPNNPTPVLPSRRKEDPQTDPKYRSNLHQLQLREIKISNRYKEQERDQRTESFQLPLGSDTERLRPLPGREGPLNNRNKEGAMTTRNREEVGSTQRQELFKIKRKSISGSLQKKLKEAQAHHLSSVHPTVPLELNYFEEGKRAYKEGKISEALRLFEMAIERSPDLADAYYHCALCYLSKRNYERSYQLLKHLTQKFASFDKKTVFLFTAISAKHLNLPSKALTALTAGISKHPDFLDLYVYRAKVSEEQGQLDEAQQDYELVLKSKKQSAEVLLGYALLLRRKGLTSNALSVLASALNCDKGELKGKILLARVRINHQLGKLQECKKDLSKLNDAVMGEESSEVQYFRGLLQMSDRNKKQALLAFQKCIRANNHPESVTGALVEITKSKIEDRDFYSALYHINRAGFLQLSSPDIEKFRLFTEGVVSMMKRKINQGVDNFYQLAERYSPLGNYFDRLFYLYRAFGHFMQSRHQLAIEDYQMAERFTPKDKHVRYNQFIAQGVVNIHQGNFQQALAIFDDAQTTISSGAPTLKIQPFIYRAMTFIEKVRAAAKGAGDELQTLQQLFRALKQLDKAYDVNDSNSNMLYLRALIYMYLGKCEDGLQDIIKAISKSEENVAKYFFYRALAHQTLGNKKQGLNDLNICINLDEKYANAYLERAKLLFSMEQAPKGIDDLRKLKEIEPNADTKLHEFCLYYLYREYDLAEVALTEMLPSERKEELEVLLDLKQLRVSNARDKMGSQADRMICEIILGHWSVEETPPDDLHFFTRVEYYSYLGIRSYHLQQYDEAINSFTLALKEKSLQDLQENAGGEREGEQAEEEGVEMGEATLQSETKGNQLHYLNYNLFLSYLANQERKKAYQTFIRDILPAKEAFLRNEQVSQLSKLLFQAMKTTGNQPNPQENDLLEVVLFRSLFGESADCVQIPLPGCTLRTKLCYLMPWSRQIEKEYSPKLNPDFILACLRISEVQNRPQPPWVRRNNQDLVFTDDVIDIDVEFQTTEHDEEQEEEQEEYQGEEGEEGTSQEEEEESREEAFDPRKFRDQMKLDDDIQRKLQKIMQRKKKTE